MVRSASAASTRSCPRNHPAARSSAVGAMADLGPAPGAPLRSVHVAREDPVEDGGDPDGGHQRGAPELPPEEPEDTQSRPRQDQEARASHDSHPERLALRPEAEALGPRLGLPLLDHGLPRRPPPHAAGGAARGLGGVGLAAGGTGLAQTGDRGGLPHGPRVPPSLYPASGRRNTTTTISSTPPRQQASPVTGSSWRNLQTESARPARQGMKGRVCAARDD